MKAMDRIVGNLKPRGFVRLRLVVE
jgi:hypothetical protein